jgi:hypothetical protein
MAEEIFLNTTAPGFKAQEDDLIRQGFIEKKYTRATADEIKGALRRYILKQAPPGALNTPNKVAAFQPVIEAEIEKLYITTASGEKFLKIKMYVPSPKLQKAREAAMMKEEIEAEEAFAPENYAEMATLAEKAEQLTRGLLNRVRVLTPNSKVNNLNKAVVNSAKAKSRIIKMLPKVQSNPDLAARVGAAINTLTKIEAHSQALRAEYSRPVNELAAMMAHTNFGTHVQRRPNGTWVQIEEYKNYPPELKSRLAEMGIPNRGPAGAAASNNGNIAAMMGRMGIGKGGKTKRHTKRRSHTKRKQRRHTRRN